MVRHKGYEYCLIDGGHPDGVYSHSWPDFLTIPQGWEQPPATAEVIQEVVATHTWSTSWVHLADTEKAWRSKGSKEDPGDMVQVLDGGTDSVEVGMAWMQGSMSLGGMNGGERAGHEGNLPIRVDGCKVKANEVHCRILIRRKQRRSFLTSQEQEE